MGILWDLSCISSRRGIFRKDYDVQMDLELENRKECPHFENRSGMQLACL